VHDFEVRGTPIGSSKSDLLGSNERVIDVVEDALEFNDNIEALKRSKQLWLVSN
jgi:hypothetical protein